MKVQGYEHRDIWWKNGKGFRIEVMRHGFDNLPDLGTDIMRNIWCLYCIIFPDHVLFDKIKKANEKTGDKFFDFNGGCTYAEWTKAKGKIDTKKFGCDYAHWQDRDMQAADIPEKATRVFKDAEDLFNKLSKNEEWSDKE